MMSTFGALQTPATNKNSLLGNVILDQPPLGPNSQVLLFKDRFRLFQNHLYDLAMRLTLTIRHGLPVHVHCGGNRSMSH